MSLNTRFPGLIPSEQQTPLIEQSRRLEMHSYHAVAPGDFYLINALNRLLESTSDGGVLLRTPTELRWTCRSPVTYADSNRSIVILAQVTLSQNFLTRTPDNLTEKSPFKSAPHLETLHWIKKVTGLSQERIGRLVGVTRQTLNNWENDEQIADINRQRLFAVHDVLERAAQRHPTQAQLIAWLDTPRGAEGRTPAQLLEANEIDKARLFAVATPSSHLISTPAWVKQPVPKAFLTGAEHYEEALPPEQNEEMSIVDVEEDDGFLVLDNGANEEGLSLS